MRGAPERNALVIEEYRANDGRLGGQFAGIDVLLLHSIDTRSGEDRVHPLTYGTLDPDDGADWVLFATNSGAEENPTWFDNLVARPAVRLEFGTGTVPAVARVPERVERDRIWGDWKRIRPNFGEYEQLTSRVIPVVVLRRS